MNKSFTEDDYVRISNEIIKILADNGATYRTANTIMKYVYYILKDQKVSAPTE